MADGKISPSDIKDAEEKLGVINSIITGVVVLWNAIKKLFKKK